MSKLLISGYYGFHNKGDDAILKALVSDLRKNFNNIELSVLTANARQTKNRYGVEVINRNKYFKTIKAIFKSDIVISGGGSLLQDITSPRSLYYYLCIILISRIFRKKILLIGHGIGPISNKFNRFLTKIVLNKVDYISVREKHSKEDLIDMGITNEITVTSDPVIDLTPTDIELGRSILRDKINVDKKTVGISIRSIDFVNPKQYEQLKKFIESASKKVNLVFLPFHLEQDLQILDSLEEEFGALDATTFLKSNYSVDEMLSIMDNFDLLIGVRLHSLIFASVVNTPIIGISYDPKIEYYLNTLSMKPIFNVANFNSEQLYQEMMEVLSYSSEELAAYKNKVDALKGKFQKNIEALKEYIK